MLQRGLTVLGAAFFEAVFFADLAATLFDSLVAMMNLLERN
jgi:hypothetical protein